MSRPKRLCHRSRWRRGFCLVAIRTRCNPVLETGQQWEIDASNMRLFSAGSKEVLSTKYLKTKKKILIKAKKLGFSDLMIHLKNGKKISYQIYVISKRNHLSLAQLIELGRQFNLKTDVFGEYVTLTGILKERINYNLLVNCE